MMTNTPDLPDLKPDRDPDADADLDVVADSAIEPSPELVSSSDAPTRSSASFVVLAVSLVMFAGAAAYVVGAMMTANDETDAAQTRAEEQIELFDPTEFTNEFSADSETPQSLPLADDPSNDEATSPATSDAATPGGDTVDESDEPLTGTSAPSPSINPNDIALAFINRVPGDEYGLVGYLDPTGERHVTELECSRLDLNEAGGICLSATAGLAGSGRGLLLDAGLNPTLRFGVNRPSRAAVSPDGAVVAWTGFSLGHSYLNPGEFATTTQLISVERSLGVNVQDDFVTYRDDLVVDDPTVNFWGVTFVDSDHFYATMGTTSGMSIVEGRVSNSRMDVVLENATCGEISPDGRTLVAKERRGDFMQVVAIDIETGSRRDLGETRSVDDQVEWADDDTVLYALPNPDEGTAAQPVYDIWALDIDPGSQARMILPFADSPAA